MPVVKVGDLTKPQKSVVESVPRGVKLMQGPAGTGKTTAGVRRMLRLLTKDKVFANEILVMVPQRALGIPYQDAIDDPGLDAGGRVTLTTIGSLSRNVVDLFFPLVADEFPFGNPYRRPTFLTLETAQYHMTHVVGRVIEERGFFDMVAIARNRLYSQIIDNLNKAALVGFPHTEVAARLKGAWGDKDRAQQTTYEHAQICADLFRAHCLENNLIDFSLQVELFRALWKQVPVQNYLIGKYRHLIIDNIEEDAPISHDILLDWIPQAESALIIEDTDAGYRRFLGAAPSSAARVTGLVTANRDTFVFTEADSFVTSPPLRGFARQLATSLDQPLPGEPEEADPREVVKYDQPRYYTGMLDRVAEVISAMVHRDHVPPGEIVVLAPFLSDSLRFTLMDALEHQDVAAYSHRPSRALREEQAAQAMLTWAQVAHPEWGLRPTVFDMTMALVSSVAGMDLVRAQLAARTLYHKGAFHSFDALSSAAVRDRITYTFGNKLEAIYQWLKAYDEAPMDEIDLFWNRLFGEVLSRSGFGFNQDFEAATVAANLIDSARKFRHVVAGVDLGRPVAQEYVQMVLDGVIADQYLREWRTEHEDKVLIAPAYTFLMMNRPVDYQFWLNVGSPGWWERLYQPLTHPYVLTQDWDGSVWTDEDEYRARNETMYRVALGLIRRCRSGIYLGFSELGEQGYEQRGPLLGAVQGMLRRLSQEAGEHV